MTLIQALEKQIPTVRSLLVGISPARLEEVWWEDRGFDFICSFGLSVSLYTKTRGWLDEGAKRRLVFVEDRPEFLAGLLEDEEAILLLNDLRVKLYFLESPLGLAPLAKKIAWSAVFLKMEVLNVAHSPYFEAFREVLEATHLAANLLLSDGADWGCSLIQHAKHNLRRPFRRAADLCFPNIPAIVVGAGPSLEKNGQFLEKFQHRALILAGGSALSRIEVEPHFSVAIDKEKALKEISFPEAPFCFQVRAHPENFSLAKGEPLLVPESHFSLLNWLSGEEALFDGGWTVGNLMTALAVRWGCNPIIFVGMDYCYSGKKKYAQGADEVALGLVEVKDRAGRAVWTQRDWLMAIQWTERLAKECPGRQFLNATEGGLAFLSSVKLEDLHYEEIPSLKKMVRESIDRLPVHKPTDRWGEWERSLRRSLLLCAECLEGKEVDFEGEIAYRLLLIPLWQIWKPVFERELELDPLNMGYKEKMRLNEVLFYEQVIQEHLDVL